MNILLCEANSKKNGYGSRPSALILLSVATVQYRLSFKPPVHSCHSLENYVKLGVAATYYKNYALPLIKYSPFLPLSKCKVS